MMVTLTFCQILLMLDTPLMVELSLLTVVHPYFADVTPVHRIGLPKLHTQGRTEVYRAVQHVTQLWCCMQQGKVQC